MSPGLQPSPSFRWVALAIGVAVVMSLLPFVWSTTFFTDDHLFLAFARYAPNPLVAFVRDQHGGEYYRPLSMSLWWLLARVGGGAIGPFAVVAAALHVAVALQVGLLVASLRRDQHSAAVIAAGFFFLSPQTRETALWFAALPDLMATAAVLGALIALVRARMALSTALAVVAYLSKESAVILPALELLALMMVSAAGGRRANDTGAGRHGRRAGWVVVAHGVLAAAYLSVRWHVLRGWGGAGDERAPLLGKLIQVASGLVHSVVGGDFFPEALAWGAGVALFSVALYATARRAREVGPTALAPLAFIAVAVAPLFGAGWVVGARYFYLPTVGLAWLVGQAFSDAGAPARVAGVVMMLALGLIHTVARHTEVASYDRRVDAARRAVVAGVAQGHHLYHVDGGIKDLDLAVKESAALRPVEDQLLVLGDVPASFVSLPAAMTDTVEFLLATPPLPPSGGYRFGSRRIVGLARRGDEPTLDEVLARFPDLRLVRLRPTPGGHVVARDVTDEIKMNLED